MHANPSSPPPDAPQLRGLWELMRGASTPLDAEATSPNPAETSVAQPEPSIPPADESEPPLAEATSAPKSLWQVMRGASAQHQPNFEETSPLAATTPPCLPESDLPCPETEATPLNEVVVVVADEDIVESSHDDSQTTPLPQSPWTRLEVGLLAGGLAAIGLSLGALLPGIVFSLPAAACGLWVVGRAAAVWSSASATRRQCRIALLSAGLGTLGLLLGPLLFAPLRTAHGRGQTGTAANLWRIGRALQQHQAEFGSFPIGSATLPDPTGRPRSGLGWLSRLLPYVGATEVYRRLDFQKPYDDPANRPALATPIPAFYATGGDRSPVAGLAVAHFAGVGGTVTDARGEEHAAGLFEKDRAIKAEEITDGLAHTLAAGELPGGYPPWGDPENWRTVGRGLNREVRGFGNTAGTGAWFLLADGQVRFFSNRTDPELLRRLSTRSAEDAVAGYEPAP